MRPLYKFLVAFVRQSVDRFRLGLHTSSLLASHESITLCKELVIFHYVFSKVSFMKLFNKTDQKDGGTEFHKKSA